MWLEAAPGYQLKKGKKQNRGKRGREGNIKIVHGHPGMFLRHVSAVPRMVWRMAWIVVGVSAEEVGKGGGACGIP